MSQAILKDYSETERAAYLGAIASIATADHAATDEELEYISELAEAAQLNQEQKGVVIRAATELSTDELKECLQILKTSELRFSLITDLISFAESDGHYSDEEKANIAMISTELNINKEQFSLLDEFVRKSASMPTPTEDQDVETQTQGFLKQQGLSDKFSQAGINIGSLTKGLIGSAGPIILSQMLSRRGGRGGGMLGGGGGLLGGLLGGGMLGGGMLGGGMGAGLGGRRGGGLGSIISMLSGGRGYGRSGGLLGRLFS